VASRLRLPFRLDIVCSSTESGDWTCPGGVNSLPTSQIVLAALNFGAIALGVAAGGLAAALLALVISGLLAVVGVESGPDIGLILGILAGLAAGGWVAGSRAVHSHRFHGMVTGLVLAFVIMVIARLGGSSAPTLTVVWLALLSIIVAGLFGWLAGRRKSSTASEEDSREAGG
jgi:hypothetical protein